MDARSKMRRRAAAAMKAWRESSPEVRAELHQLETRRDRSERRYERLVDRRVVVNPDGSLAVPPGWLPELEDDTVRACPDAPLPLPSEQDYTGKRAA